MAWTKFPYSLADYQYTKAALKQAWSGLHAGDVEPWPHNAAVVDAWIAFHAGAFEQAARQGLDAGLAGYAVANKATCVHAVYLDKSAQSKCARLQEVAERCEQQQAQQPECAAAFYWHAYALGRYSQEISVLKALAQGIGHKVKASLDTTLKLAERHADAHIVAIDLRGFPPVTGCNAVQIFGTDLLATNTEQAPDAVRPIEHTDFSVNTDRIVTRLHPLSWNVLSLSY